jgi:hypothetical protein
MYGTVSNIYAIDVKEVREKALVMFVKARNKAKRKFVNANEAIFFASKRKIQSETKRKQTKKFVLDFRLSKRKQSETDPVSLRFGVTRVRWVIGKSAGECRKIIKVLLQKSSSSIKKLI